MHMISAVMKLSGEKIHGPGGATGMLAVKPNTLRARMDRPGIRCGRKMKSA